jgi:hypothetical protein
MAAVMISGVSFCVGMSVCTFHGSAFLGTNRG